MPNFVERYIGNQVWIGFNTFSLQRHPTKFGMASPVGLFNAGVV